MKQYTVIEKNKGFQMGQAGETSLVIMFNKNDAKACV